MRNWLHWLVRMSGGTFILVLPIGYYPQSPDSSQVMVGVHGGSGQIMSVVRDCSGNPLASSANTYTDVAGSGYIAVPGSPVVLGIRGGYFESNVRLADTYYQTIPRQRASYSYVNPNISLEARKVGFGVGLILGKVPVRLEDFFDTEAEHVTFSSHLRIGDIRGGYLMASIAENTPLISGGSWFDLGLGYTLSPKFQGFTGLSAGMYDRAGFLQQGRFRIHRHVDLDVSLRLGGADGSFEGGISAGLVYRFGATGRRVGSREAPEPDTVWNPRRIDW